MFQLGFAQERPALFVVICARCFTIDTIESAETTFNQFKSFLTFNEVKTKRHQLASSQDQSERHERHRSKFEARLQDLLVNQEFVVEVQEAFSGLAVKSLTRAASSNWIRVAPAAANLAFLVAAAKLSTGILSAFTLFFQGLMVKEE